MGERDTRFMSVCGTRRDDSSVPTHPPCLRDESETSSPTFLSDPPGSDPGPRAKDDEPHPNPFPTRMRLTRRSTLNSKEGPSATKENQVLRGSCGRNKKKDATALPSVHNLMN